ncbi:MAG TPA: hypothetical protein VGN34_33560 [Ktedonobacteraceae bacterium]
MRALQVIISYAKHWAIPLPQMLVRLDGVYGNAVPLGDVLTSGLGLIARGKDYTLLDLPQVKAVLARPPIETSIHPESQVARALFDCPAVTLSPTGPSVRLIVATHAATSSPLSVGVQRAETVYDLFVSTLASPAFTAKDVLDLYLHRGSFETVLADEDRARSRPLGFSYGLWAGTLPDPRAMGVESAPGARPATRSGGVTHHQIRNCFRRFARPDQHLSLPSSMVLLNGRNGRLLGNFPDRPLPCNPMVACAVPPTTLCIHRNADQNAMTPSCLVCWAQRPLSHLPAADPMSRKPVYHQTTTGPRCVLASPGCSPASTSSPGFAHPVWSCTVEGLALLSASAPLAESDPLRNRDHIMGTCSHGLADE